MNHFIPSSPQRGFAALTAALIVSATLLVLTIAATESAFLSTKNSRAALSHAEARTRADDCRELAAFLLARDGSTALNASTTYFTNEDTTCTIALLAAENSRVLVRTVSSNAHAISILRSELEIVGSSSMPILISSYEEAI